MEQNALKTLPVKILSQFTEISRDVLSDNLIGIYLHGSAVMGCFNPQKSDLDLIIVVNGTVLDTIKLEYMEKMVKLNEEAPLKGFEWSIVKKEFCKPFIYPTPYELHFSNSHLKWFQENPTDYIQKMRGTDKDLAAHFTIINQYGKVLFGEEISMVFDVVPRKNYIDSIWLDVQNAREDGISNPVYTVLNLCRVLAFLQDSLILSKKMGGQWGIQSLPKKYHPLIQIALDSYIGDAEASLFSEKSVHQFAEYMISQIVKLK